MFWTHCWKYSLLLVISYTLEQKQCDDIKTLHFSHFISNFDYLRYSNVPFVVTDVPMSSEDLSRDAILNDLPGIASRMNSGVASSLNPLFTYHDDNHKPWSISYNLTAEHIIKPYGTLNLSFCLSDRSTTSNNKPKEYLHMSQHIYLRTKADPFYPPLVDKLLPWIRTKLLSLSCSFGPSLWFSNNPDVYVTSHYDLEHNFYAQLTGSKVFFLGPPSTAPFFNLYPSLHPRHRHGQNRHYISNESVNSASVAKYGLQEIILHANQLLYIPPMYFHAVGRGRKSSSLNVWVCSHVGDVVVNLETKSQVAWASSAETLSDRLSALATCMRMVYTQLMRNSRDLCNRYAYFVDMAERRYSQLVKSNEMYQDINQVKTLCHKNATLHLNRKAVNTIVSILTKESAATDRPLDPFVQGIILLDAMEDQFELAAQQSRNDKLFDQEFIVSPQTLLNYVQSCLRTQEL